MATLVRDRPIDPLVQQILAFGAALLGGGTFLVALVNRATSRDSLLEGRLGRMEARIKELEGDVKALQRELNESQKANAELVKEKGLLEVQLASLQETVVDQNKALLEAEKRAMRQKRALRQVVKEFPEAAKIISKIRAEEDLDEDEQQHGE